ncbi:hypothetical protein DLE54_05660 [Psychrobacter sp. YP14]|uniref:hypothetical protein n=1 Tax=Psychrobacter sp. YP14 TaxID=2203895 RepID=UPI000D7EA529|nr:hypothetical protein [Psychrobacter sp. YP14]AWT49064.1 hypothetical protein DLE54_05660 [Psychrobacter sp. YP14]
MLKLISVMIMSSAMMAGCSSAPFSQQYSGRAANAMSAASLDQEETILGMAYPVYDGARQPGIVLIGSQYSYLISSGTQALDQVTQLNGGNRLNGLNRLNGQQLDIHEPIIINKYPDNSVQIQLAFEIQSAHSTKNSLPAPLNSSCKLTDAAHYSCNLSLQGGMYAALDNHSSMGFKLGEGVKALIHPTGSKRFKTQAELGVVPLKVLLETLALPLEIISIFK